MTYAGFKSLLHAGLNEEDPRVSAALDWIKSNWTFAENPGAGKQGVYYYRHALGRTMQVSGMEQILTTDGIAHPWRSELIAALIADQNEEGYWVNPEPRWLEGEKTLATCYAILALEEALKGSGRLSSPLETPESDSSDRVTPAQE